MSAEENVKTILRFHDAIEAPDHEALDAMLEEIAHPEAEAEAAAQELREASRA